MDAFNANAITGRRSERRIRLSSTQTVEQNILSPCRNRGNLDGFLSGAFFAPRPAISERPHLHQTTTKKKKNWASFSAELHNLLNPHILLEISSSIVKALGVKAVFLSGFT